jgi:Ca-activated chloride channel family protein
MTLRLLIITSILLFAALGTRAQGIKEGATDFFNGGAQFYISNNIPDALKRVESGLKIYPEDPKLKKLEELLKQQQQQQQQNQQNQQNQQQKSQQNQQNQSKQKQQSQSQNQQQKQQQQKPDQQQKSQQNQQNQANSQKQQEQKAQQAHAMTPEDAKRLLDAQKGNEQLLQFKPQNQPQNANPTVKDW